jgi:small-conductance mechanosensitive channel
MTFATFEPWSVFVVVFFTALVITLFLKQLIWNRLMRWSSRAENMWGQGLLVGLNRPAKCVVFGLTLSFSNHFVPETFKHQAFIALGMRIYFVILVIWIIDRLANITLKSHPYFKSITAGTLQLILFALRILIFCLGLLVVLDNLGISITPLLASLGVGSVAVALALQDTLNNFFSGVYVLADRPIRIDDYIRLEDGTEGYVARIGWRSTHIRLPSNSLVIVPNSKIASAQLTNYNMPSEETTFRVDVGVSYDCDLNHVERITQQVATNIMLTRQEGVTSFAPLVRFHTFADSSINFTVTMQTKHFADSGVLKHEFIKQLHAAYKTENIDIPFPHRVIVNTRQDSSPSA